MRFTGKLAVWHDDRGFGFIKPDNGGQDIFVHASAMPYGIKPQTGQAFEFEVALNAQGKKKAVGVCVSAKAEVKGNARAAPAFSRSAAPTAGGWFRTSVFMVIVAAIAWTGYHRFIGNRFMTPATPESVAPVAAPQRNTGSIAPAPSIYSCGGRTMCSQMTSCAEATWVLQNCPGTKMDGNGDGVPCEQQFCRPSGLR